MLKEVDEEESARELENYCKDQSTIHNQPDSMSFQDRYSTGHWSSAKKNTFECRDYAPNNSNTENMQGFHSQDHRKYSSKVDNYEPLRYQHISRDFRAKSIAGSETYQGIF